MSEQDATDQDGVADEMTDAQLDEFLDAPDDSADNAFGDEDVDDTADDDDSPVNLHASLGLSDADRDDLGGVDEDEGAESNVIEPMTDAQLLADEKIRAKNRRDPGRVIDNLNEQTGPKIAAARWAQHFEAERQASIDAASPEAEAANEARAIATAAAFFEAEDADPGPGFISGEGSEHDADDAKRRFANAKDRWRDWCADPDN